MEESANLKISQVKLSSSRKERKRLNENDKDTASDAMCTFLTINTAGIQLLPISVIAILMSIGDKNPTDIILPTILTTVGALTIGLIAVKILIKLKPERNSQKND